MAALLLLRASDATGRACRLLQGRFCSAVTWPRSLFASLEMQQAQLWTFTHRVAHPWFNSTRTCMCQITL